MKSGAKLRDQLAVPAVNNNLKHSMAVANGAQKATSFCAAQDLTTNATGKQFKFVDLFV